MSKNNLSGSVIRSKPRTFFLQKLSRIAHRKPPAKGSLQASQSIQTATDQKYALLFHITPFQLGNLGKFDVWTLSLPIMVSEGGGRGPKRSRGLLSRRTRPKKSGTDHGQGERTRKIRTREHGDKQEKAQNLTFKNPETLQKSRENAGPE